MIDVEHEPRQLLVGATLMLITVLIQTCGAVVLEGAVARVRGPGEKRMSPFRMLGVLCGVMVYVFGLHILEMLLWAGFYRLAADYRSLSVALYESALAFTTMDVADLPPRWKFLSAAEGVTGLLMFAWSTGLIFAQTSWINDARRNYRIKRSPFGANERVPPPGA